MEPHRKHLTWSPAAQLHQITTLEELTVHEGMHLVGLCIMHVQIHYILPAKTDEIVQNLTRRNDGSLNSPFRPEASHWMSYTQVFVYGGGSRESPTNARGVLTNCCQYTICKHISHGRCIYLANVQILNITNKKRALQQQTNWWCCPDIDCEKLELFTIGSTNTFHIISMCA